MITAHDIVEQIKEAASALDSVSGTNFRALIESNSSLVFLLVFVLLGGGLLLRWIVNRRSKRRGELRSQFDRSIHALADGSVAERVVALRDLESVAMKSRSLLPLALSAIADFIRETSPALPEVGRTVLINELGTGEFSVRLDQQYGGDIHAFAQRELSRAVPEARRDLEVAVDILINLAKRSDRAQRRVDLSRCDLSGLVFAHASLPGALFLGSTIRRGQFQDADLTGARFDGAILTDSRFDGSTLVGANLSFSLAHRIALDRSDLTGCRFFAADIYDASIQNANAHDTDFSGAQAWRLQGGLADLAGATFFGTDLTGADLHAARNLSPDQIRTDRGLVMPTLDKNTKFPWVA